MRFVLVVRSTEHPHPVARRATERHRHHVVELEEPGLLAAPSVVRYERAAKPIPRHRLSPRLARHVPLHAARLLRARPLRLAEPLPLDLVEKPVEHAVEHV